MIVDRELCLIPLLKERIRSEWDLKEWVMIDLFFEDDVGKDQRTIQVRLRGKKPAVLLEDANDEDVNYGFDEEELAELPSTEDNPLGQAKFRSIPGSSDGI